MKTVSTTSRTIARVMVAALALLIFWAGFWMYHAHTELGSPVMGFVTASPLWFIGGVGFLSALFAKPKHTKS